MAVVSHGSSCGGEADLTGIMVCHSTGAGSLLSNVNYCNSNINGGSSIDNKINNSSKCNSKNSKKKNGGCSSSNNISSNENGIIGSSSNISQAQNNNGSSISNGVAVGTAGVGTTGVGSGKICRDYLRRVCRRGVRCKFVHVEGSTDESSQSSATSTSVNAGNNSNGNNNSGSNGTNGGSVGGNQQQGCGTAVSATQGNTQLTFCHDYQNSHCSRNCCKFIHCTCDEENQYLETGHIPPHVLDQAIRKGQMADATLNGDIPICKDYLMGECEKRRGGKCKFRHLNQTEYHHEIYGYSTITPPPQPPPPPTPYHNQPHPPPCSTAATNPPEHLMNGGGGPGTRIMEVMDIGVRPPINGAPDVYESNGHNGRPLPTIPPPQGAMTNGMAPPEHKRQRLDPSMGVRPMMLYPPQPEFAVKEHEYGDREYSTALHGGMNSDDMTGFRTARDMVANRPAAPFMEREPMNEWEMRGMEMTIMRKQIENMKKEIICLKKDNCDLRATNDFLLDKVTSLGASKMNGHVSSSSNSLPIVSLAPTLAPTLAAASTLTSLSASLSAAAAQVTPVSHPLTLGPHMSIALPQTVAHTTIPPPTIAPPTIAQATECTVQTGVHSLTNPLSITSISSDGSVGSVVAIAAPPPTQPPPPPPPLPLVPSQNVAVAAAAAPTAVVVSVGTVQVPLSQASITITSGTLNPRITTTSMSMTLPSIATATTIVPSIGQTIAAPSGSAVAAAANIAQAISMSQGGPNISLSQAGQAISMSQGAPSISLSQAGQAISMSQGGPPISLSQGVPPISLSQGGPSISLSQGGPSMSLSQGGPPISLSQGVPPISLSQAGQAISISQGGQAITMSQGGPTISMTAPPISMSAPQAIAISGPPMSMSGAAAGQLLSYPIMTQPTLRTQLH